MFKILCSVFILLFSSAALSENVLAVGKITLLTNYEGHQGTIFTLDDMTKSEGSCSRNDFFILPLDHKYFDQNYSMLLAAMLASREVRVLFDMQDCVDSLPRLKHLSIM